MKITSDFHRLCIKYLSILGKSMFFCCWFLGDRYPQLHLPRRGKGEGLKGKGKKNIPEVI